MWNKAIRSKYECNSHSQFLQMTVQSTEEIPGGGTELYSWSLPIPTPLLPLPAATAAPLPLKTQIWLFPAFPLFLLSLY